MPRRDTPASKASHREKNPVQRDINPSPSATPPIVPTTPPHNTRRGRGKESLKLPRTRLSTNLREAFAADGKARDGSAETHHRKQSSHDLSWAPRQTRDSVMDNMLLSLDQMFVPPTAEDSSITTVPTEIFELGSEKMPRSRTHALSSSVSSDQSLNLIESSPPRSNNNPRSRHRSNSSSSFRSGLERINSVSVRDQQEEQLTIRERLYESQRAAAPGVRIRRPSNRHRKGSKGSTGSSLDLSQMLNDSRLQVHTERNSSSIDGGKEIRNTTPVPISIYNQGASTAANSRTPTMSGSHRTDDYDVYESAPTPSIPAGPSRKGVSLLSGALPQTMEARRKANIEATDRVRAAERTDVNSKAPTTKERTHRAEDSHLERGIRTPRARSQEANLIEQDPANALNKERPGFFRRVFGSSRSVPTMTLEAPHSDLRMAHSSASSIRLESRNGMATNTGKLSKTPPENSLTNTSSKEVPPLPLNKKSSFFRRRKKSISDEPPIPLRPHEDMVSLPAPANSHEPMPSPVSSLRKLMDPYLAQEPPPKIPLTVKGQNREPNGGETAPRSNRQSIFTPRIDSLMNPITMTDLPQSSDRVSPREETLGTSNAPSVRSSVSTQPAFSKPEPRKSSVRSVYDADALTPRTEEAHAHTNNPTKLRIAEMTDKSSTALFENRPSASDSARSSVSRYATPLTSRAVNTLETASQAAEEKPNADTLAVRASITKLPTRTSSKSKLRPSRSDDEITKIRVRPSVITTATTITSPTAPWSSQTSVSVYADAVSKLNTPADDGPTMTGQSSQTASGPLVAPIVDEDEPTETERVLAWKIFSGDESEVEKSKAAQYLGEAGKDRTRVRQAYMEHYEWQNVNILVALRGLCGRLILKGETQQVDRIFDAFSTRWCQCNPNHGFKAVGKSSIPPLKISLLTGVDVVHTICYSIVLLNTDLHMADIEQKMTRTQFIRNTVPSIRRVVADAVPNAFDNAHIPSKNLTDPSPSPAQRTSSFPAGGAHSRESSEVRRPAHRLSTRPSDHSGEITLNMVPTSLEYGAPSGEDCGPLVKTPFTGKQGQWEIQIELVLKDFYNSIRQQKLPLHGSEELEKPHEGGYASGSFSAFAGGMLRRTPSMLSKAGSENQASKGRREDMRFGTGRWASKGRPRPKLYATSTTGAASSRTSFDDQSSAISPSASSTWTKYSLNKTQTTMSVDSFSSAFPQGDYKQSIGFANALSQAIIREDTSTSLYGDESMKAIPLLDDENLELAGAPWAKEGIMKHKHHLESTDKKAKTRSWTETFAVIEKGWMRLFSFNTNARSMRMKAKQLRTAGGVVGGGNWTENAEALGKFMLRHTIASALPPPGYSKARPHVWALSLPTGAIHLFQAGTPEIVKEFVATANYWSARLSKEPLVGGISNMEYGWSEHIINTALLSDNRPASNSSHMRKASFQSSIRSSMEQATNRPKLPADRVTINDWSPPQQSMMASNLLEVDQLRAITVYVKNVEEELQRHNKLKDLIVVAYSTRHPNHTKAMGNWERKSQYLLREIIKFQTYIDALSAAQTQKDSFYAEQRMKEGTREDGGDVDLAAK
ncbi:hypothetical protein MMC25_005109 [Agyrium rufum]|nr:hypothetical protein [Agyrium rufum]